MTRVLGIETSCDETGVAVVEDGKCIVAEAVASQISVHAPFGGVVPEIASRQHTTCISQLTEKVLAVADDVDAVAVTVGPGLMGSLMVGVNFGKALAYARKKPFVPVHHIEGHIFSVFLADEEVKFPFLALIVSGGHTMLVQCNAPHQYEVVGKTRDDAVGEAFDKVARLLELPYPGGPSIEKASREGDAEAIRFPRGLSAEDTFDFSYSGLKTAVLYYLQQHPGRSPKLVADIAASFQSAAVGALVEKAAACAGAKGSERLVVAGGVAANQLLRERISAALDIPVSMPPMSLCVDNGAMIAAAGESRLRHGFTGGWNVTPDPNLALC